MIQKWYNNVLIWILIELNEYKKHGGTCASVLNSDKLEYIIYNTPSQPQNANYIEYLTMTILNSLFSLMYNVFNNIFSTIN